MLRSRKRQSARQPGPDGRTQRPVGGDRWTEATSSWAARRDQSRRVRTIASRDSLRELDHSTATPLWPNMAISLCLPRAGWPTTQRAMPLCCTGAETPDWREGIGGRSENSRIHPDCVRGTRRENSRGNQGRTGLQQRHNPTTASDSDSSQRQRYVNALSPTTRNREGPEKPECTGYGVAPCLSMSDITRVGRALAALAQKRPIRAPVGATRVRRSGCRWRGR